MSQQLCKAIQEAGKDPAKLTREQCLKYSEKRVYTLHGKTKQSQKDETDINKLLTRASRSDQLTHLAQYQAQYGDFSTYDFEAHITKIAEGQTIFENLPAETKREFDQNPQKFFEYVTKPENLGRLPELLPEIARQGEYFPPVGQILTREPETKPALESKTVKTVEKGSETPKKGKETE